MKEKNALTMLTIATGFLLIYLIFKWQGFLIISLGIGIIGVFSSYLTAKIAWLWIKLGEILGLIVPKIILGVIFFLILFPISLIVRLFRKDPLMLSQKHTTYFLDHTIITRDKSYFEKSW